jgi:hypothetical protein
MILYCLQADWHITLFGILLFPQDQVGHKLSQKHAKQPVASQVAVKPAVSGT